MKRLNKAAVATGVAAVILVGGAGTYAYWTGTGTATGPGSLTTGNLTVTGQQCAPWLYVDGTTVTDIVPGDVVHTTCTVTVTGLGDHLTVSAALDPTSAQLSGPLSGIVTLNTSNVTVDGTASALPTNISLAGTTEQTHTIVVDVTATFPYGDATTTSTDTTQNLTDTLSAVVINVTQNPPSPTSAP